MNENPAVSEWAASRGEKWRTRCAGMEAMLAPVGEPLLAALHLDGASRIADIGCGGGGMTLDIRRRAPSGSIVHGFDISPALIELAHDRTPQGEPAIAFAVADMATATPEKAYDRVVSRFGIMFFDDAPAAFANIFRWLAPGGRFAFAAWGPVAENWWMTSVRDVVAGIVDLPAPDPEAPGAFRYADAGKLLSLLSQAGFGKLDVQDWRGALTIGGGLPAAESANFALAAFSSFGELLAEAGDAAVNHARELLTSRFTPLEKDGGVQLEACVHIFTGVRLG